MKRMRKRMVTVCACALAAMLLFSGCGIRETMTINADLSSKSQTRVYYTKDEVSALKEIAEDDSAEYTKEKISGKTFYYSEKEDVTEKAPAKKTAKNFIVLNKSKMEAGASSEDLNDADNDLTDEQIAELIDFATLEITFPKKVLKANGKISKDGKTVTYDLVKLAKKGTPRIYAAMSKKAATSKKVTISGVKNNKTYKSAKVVKISSPGVIQWVKVNGKPVDKNTYKASKNGKYTVTVKLLSGKKKTVKFTIKK